MTDAAVRNGPFAFDDDQNEESLRDKENTAIIEGRECAHVGERVQREGIFLSFQEMANLDNSDPRKARFLRAFLLTKYLQDDSTPCEIQEGIFLGSIGAACNKDVLKDLQITHVLAIANNIEMPFPDDFKYKLIEVLDSPDVNLQQYFDSCFDFIDQARRQGGAILVHCFAGRSRSVTVVVAYLMRTFALSLSQALDLVKMKRPEASPNIGFLRQLQNFEHQLTCSKTAQSAPNNSV